MRRRAAPRSQDVGRSLCVRWSSGVAGGGSRLLKGANRRLLRDGHSLAGTCAGTCRRRGCAPQAGCLAPWAPACPWGGGGVGGAFLGGGGLWQPPGESQGMRQRPSQRPGKEAVSGRRLVPVSVVTLVRPVKPSPKAGPPSAHPGPGAERVDKAQRLLFTTNDNMGLTAPLPPGHWFCIFHFNWPLCFFS